MTDDRLDFIEKHFRNPHSVSGLAEFGLELVDELRVLRAEASSAKHVYAKSTAESVDHRLAQAPPDELPTPPMGVVIDDRPEPKKKGKR